VQQVQQQQQQQQQVQSSSSSKCNSSSSSSSSNININSKIGLSEARAQAKQKRAAETMDANRFLRARLTKKVCGCKGVQSCYLKLADLPDCANTLAELVASSWASSKAAFYHHHQSLHDAAEFHEDGNVTFRYRIALISVCKETYVWVYNIPSSSVSRMLANVRMHKTK
jgi:hypothetical protein